jgi:hypothetical protein
MSSLLHNYTVLYLVEWAGECLPLDDAIEGELFPLC